MRHARTTSQTGSAFFIILIAIAMFAMLTYALSKGNRSSSTMLSSDQARLAAEEIIAYGDAIQKAVQTLRLRGCSDTQLNFTNTASKQRGGTVYTYTNGQSPADGSCHVFDIRGGKVTARLLTSGYVDPALLPNDGWMHSASFIITASRLQGAGTDSASASGTDIVIWIGRLKPEVCMKINEILGVENPSNEPPTDTFDCDSNTFQGSYTGCADPIGDVPALQNSRAYCSGYNNSGIMYNYFQTLVAR